MKLFEPDNHHSDTPTVSYKSCSRHTPILEVVHKHYCNVIPKNSPLALIEGPNMNSLNFRLGDIYLKILKSDQITDRLHSFPAISSALNANGIPSLPFLENTDGKKVTLFEILGTEYAAITQPFLDHHYYSGNRNSFKEMLRVIDKLDNVFFNIKPSADHFIPYKMLDPSVILFETSDRLLLKKKSGDLTVFDKKIIDILPNLKIISNFFENNRSHLIFEQLHHYDLHPHNLLFQNDKLSCLLDLDNISIVDGRIAKGFNLFKVGRKALAKKHISMDEFKKTTNDMFPMAELKNFALIELLQRFLILMDLKYLKNDERRDFELFKYTAAIKEIDLMFTV